MDFDAVVLGTGLSQSITAAALSKAGFKVAHIDSNAYYGGDDASLTLDELVQWAEQRTNLSTTSTYISAQRSRFASIKCSLPVPPQSPRYSISLAPSIIPSIGPLIDALVSSGVSRYGGFKLLERVALYEGEGRVRSVPGSKEDIFKNKDLSLVEKRRLMRFLMFAAGEFETSRELEGRSQSSFPDFLQEQFSLDLKTTEVITYALAFCTTPSDPTLPALQRIRRYLRSAGRYGASPFLVGHYGGIGEIAQGFCRTSAVNGGVYVLGRTVTSVTPFSAPSKPVEQVPRQRAHTIELEDFPEPLHCDVIVTLADYIESELFTRSCPASPQPPSADPQAERATARCIAIIDRPLSFGPGLSTATSRLTALEIEAEGDKPECHSLNSQVDTAILVFPPACIPEGCPSAAVHVLITGEGSLSAPSGKWILYLSVPLTDASTAPETILRPYLDATLTLTTSTTDAESIVPIFTLFYTERSSRHTHQHPSEMGSIIASSPRSPALPELGDFATTDAEAAFWRTVNSLKASGCRPRKPRHDEDDVTEEVQESEVESFWPPLDDVGDDGGEDW